MDRFSEFESNPRKFLAQSKAMCSYLSDSGHSVVSTHVSPESACNLSCPYCSVRGREVGLRLDLSVVKSYITSLLGRGLRSVILTGGGEPLLYPHINELVLWLHTQGLFVGLITNGTQSDRMSNWSLLSWVRVSLNEFKGWKERISVPSNQIKSLGASVIFSGESLKDFVEKAKMLGCKYLRVLPDCTLDNLDQAHIAIEREVSKINDSIIFHQNKRRAQPSALVCHQAYFRPYLCEDGYVYPCDSVVLDGSMRFYDKYRICRADEVAEFLDGKIKMKFKPSCDCGQCVFTENVNMLDRWKNLVEGEFV